jgi:hypothetical protein
MVIADGVHAGSIVQSHPILQPRAVKSVMPFLNPQPAIRLRARLARHRREGLRNGADIEMKALGTLK